MPAVYPPEWVPMLPTGNYRHMAPRDAAVWERWLADQGSRWDAVAYDVALGGVILTDPAATETERRGFRYSTALKLDAVVRSRHEWQVLEVRPTASVSAVGAALSYLLLARREQLTELPIRAGIVCETFPPDIAWVVQALGLLAYVV